MSNQAPLSNWKTVPESVPTGVSSSIVFILVQCPEVGIQNATRQNTESYNLNSLYH